jgi:replicative DNA helicase
MNNTGNHIKPIALSVVQDLDNRLKVPEFPTGLYEIDDKLWMRRKELTIIASRPSNGKSNLALKIAVSTAENGRNVDFFSLEMTKERLAERYIADKLGVDNMKLARNELTADQISHIKSASQEFKSLPLRIYDNGVFKIENLVLHLKLQEKAGVLPDTLIVDYIQNTRSDKTTYGEKDERGIYTKYCEVAQQLAKDYNMLIILVSQINRGAMPEAGVHLVHAPRLHHLKGAGKLEENADAVILLHYAYLYTNDYADKYKLTAIIAKSRHGETGTVELATIPEYNRITDKGGDYAKNMEQQDIYKL